MIRLIRLLPLAALVLMACSINNLKGPARSLDSAQWRKHQQDVRNLSQYQTRGVFACISAQQKVYARFLWLQTDQDTYRLLLTNLLGSTEVELNAKPGSVELIDSKGQHHTATDAEDMFRKLTGISIPFNNLRQWILGLPGQSTDYTLDEQYHISTLNYFQDGKTWKVVYSGYDNTKQPSLPLNMELIEGNKRIKLKMDNWLIK